jgi:predicted membrane channel-forming protein YqfA (hemolysin III family)
MDTATEKPLFLSKAQLLAQRRTELAYGRALGTGTGLFLLMWAPLSVMRWSRPPAFAYFEVLVYIAYGIMLVLPYQKLRERTLWRTAFALLTFGAILFLFTLVFDVLFVANLYADDGVKGVGDSLYNYAEEGGAKIPFPTLGCALVFPALMQVPVVLFSRHPDWLD